MSEVDWLAGRFEQNRPRLRAVAYRMLGSLSEEPLDSVMGGLSGAPGGTGAAGGAGSAGAEPDRLGPEEEALLADSVGPALLAVLDPDVELRADDAAVA